MFYNSKTLRNYKLRSRDGEIGRVKDFYFDDNHWAIRYLVAETEMWLNDKQVLISPYALNSVTPEEKVISVNLTKKQIENSPSLDTDKPVSRQFENTYYGYFGWPIYWSGAHMWGVNPYLNRNPKVSKEDKKHEPTWDPHLRSTRNVSGYGIHATDGEIGHIDDFIIDDETWAIRYLIIDTKNWWPGKKVLLAPKWISRVSWSDAKALIDLPRETIKLSPAYTDGALLSRDYETELHRHYKRQGYWDEEHALESRSR